MKASRQLLGKWVNQRRLKRNPDGTYPFPETADAVQRIRAEDQDKRRRGFGNEDYQTQRARLAKERADQLERENRTRRGELVELDDVEALVRESLERVNAVLKNVPAKYGQKLARRSKLRLPDARALLSEIVEAVRAQLRTPGESNA